MVLPPMSASFSLARRGLCQNVRQLEKAVAVPAHTSFPLLAVDLALLLGKVGANNPLIDTAATRNDSTLPNILSQTWPKSLLTNPTERRQKSLWN